MKRCTSIDRMDSGVSGHMQRALTRSPTHYGFDAGKEEPKAEQSEAQRTVRERLRHPLGSRQDVRDMVWPIAGGLNWTGCLSVDKCVVSSLALSEVKSKTIRI